MRSTRPFPATATSGSAARSSSVSDHRSGHLYMSLVDPEDEGPRRDRARGRRAHAQREVLAQLVGAPPARPGQAGHRARRGHGGGPAGLARPLPGQGRDQPHPGRGRRHGAAGATGGEAGAAAPDARRRGPAAAQRRPAPARGPAARRAGGQPGHGGLSGLPRAAHRLGVRVPRLACARSPCRAPVRRPPSPGPSPPSAGATATSSPWCAAGERGRTWRPSRTKRSSAPIATATKPVFTGIGHTGDETLADIVAARACITPTECGQQIVEATRLWWTDRVVEPAALLARRVPTYLGDAQSRDAQARGRLTAAARQQLRVHRRAPGPEELVSRAGRHRTRLASSAARLRAARGAARTAEPGPPRAPGRARAVVAPAAGRLRRRPAARAGLQPDAHGRRTAGAQRGRAGRRQRDRDPLRRRYGAQPGAGGTGRTRQEEAHDRRRTKPSR